MNTATISIQEYDELRKTSQVWFKELEALKEEHRKHIEKLKESKTIYLRFSMFWTGSEKKIYMESVRFGKDFYSPRDAIETTVEEFNKMIPERIEQIREFISSLESAKINYIKKREELSDGSWANVVRAVKLFLTK